MKGTVQKLAVLALFLAMCFGAAAVGAVLTTPNIPGWYAQLDKPAWTPPSWLFGPVWSALFLLMGVSAWLVWCNAAARRAAAPWVLFGLQLVLNMAWSGLFFSLRSPGAALIEIAFLWCAILATTVTFWRHSLAAGCLLLPYLVWVGFAAALNLAIWNLNR